MNQALAGLLQPEIEELLTPLPGFRSKQIYKWIIRGVNNFEKMTDIPVSLQNELKMRFSVFSSNISAIYKDGMTKKIVISLKDENKIEAVLLSDDKNRLTACLSTQVGCPSGCVFCKTGQMGFIRDLNSAEIIEQFLHLISLSENKEQKGGNEQKHLIDNIVIMGMGEPLLNLENLRKAIKFFNDKKGLNISEKRITVSSCGIYDGLIDIAKNGPFVRLALSLTTGDEALRNKLMPVTKTNPLKKIHKTLKLFQENNGGRITLEIPLLGGINTFEKDAKSIAIFAKGLDTIINIIPWNPVEGLEFEGKPLQQPEKKETADFIKMLENYGLNVTKRLHKGRNILGACGQLGS